MMMMMIILRAIGIERTATTRLSCLFAYYKSYVIYLKKDSLCEIDKLTLTNKKEWMMSRLLNLVIEQELRERITDLTKRVYRLEKALHTGS